ncbi:hypothetical protein AVEN_114990-1 [Araneus ventricosus]|uniref:Secreted protein n=1 Tax=Araneus ventricosus TaxID=182803 RepID=A0A4Y2UQC3_ARAVE|nr:hypothetical protein AVEN_114990-1 [Araneus ventricosus]
MVTSKLALTCFKLVASLHSCHVKFVASLLQTKIAIWGRPLLVQRSPPCPPKSYYAASSWREWWPWLEWAMYVWSFFSWQGHPRREGHSILPN